MFTHILIIQIMFTQKQLKQLFVDIYKVVQNLHDFVTVNTPSKNKSSEVILCQYCENSPPNLKKQSLLCMLNVMGLSKFSTRWHNCVHDLLAHRCQNVHADCTILLFFPSPKNYLCSCKCFPKLRVRQHSLYNIQNISF